MHKQPHRKAVVREQLLFVVFVLVVNVVLASIDSRHGRHDAPEDGVRRTVLLRPWYDVDPIDGQRDVKRRDSTPHGSGQHIVLVCCSEAVRELDN